MLAKNNNKGSYRTFLILNVFFLLIFLDSITSFTKTDKSLRLLEKEMNIQESKKEIKEVNDKNNLNYYLTNILEKKRDMITRYMVNEDNLDTLLSKIKCVWVDKETYLVYNFFSLEDLMNSSE